MALSYRDMSFPVAPSFDGFKYGIAFFARAEQGVIGLDAHFIASFRRAILISAEMRDVRDPYDAR